MGHAIVKVEYRHSPTSGLQKAKSLRQTRVLLDPDSQHPNESIPFDRVRPKRVIQPMRREDRVRVLKL